MIRAVERDKMTNRFRNFDDYSHFAIVIMLMLWPVAFAGMNL